MVFIIMMVSDKETVHHCHLKNKNVDYLRTFPHDDTKIIKQHVENTSQKLDDVISLLD